MLCLAAQLCPTLCDPMDCNPPGSSVHGDSPGNSSGVGCHALLQDIFPNQGSNPGLPHCRQILYWLSHNSERRKKAFHNWAVYEYWGDKESTFTSVIKEEVMLDWAKCHGAWQKGSSSKGSETGGWWVHRDSREMSREELPKSQCLWRMLPG